MGKRVLVLAAILVLVASGCWVTGPTTGPKLGSAPAKGFHELSINPSHFSFYGCPSLQGGRCGDEFRFGFGDDDVPFPDKAGGLPSFRIDWKDPSRLTYPPAGANVVMRLEFANTIEAGDDDPFPNPFTQRCGDAGEPAEQFITASFADSNITAGNCLVTSDGRLIIDIGLKRKVGYRVHRCYHPTHQDGSIRIDLEDPPDGGSYDNSCYTAGGYQKV